jgi:hypothetical protein
MYRIAWQSLLTGYTSGGMFLFHSREDLVSSVNELNARFRGVINHWIESDDSDEVMGRVAG